MRLGDRILAKGIEQTAEGKWSKFKQETIN